MAVNAEISGPVAAFTNNVRVRRPAVFVQLSVYVCPKLWVTLVVCPLVTVPTLGEIEQVGGGVGGDEYVHVQVTFVGTPICVTAGVETNVEIVGATAGTVTTTGRVAGPALFEQVSVNVVICETVTLVVCPFVTTPTPLSTVHVGSGYGTLP